MPVRKKLVLFVEGDADERAVPVLVKQLLTSLNAWDALSLDPYPFRVGELANLVGRSESNWTNKLKAALKRKDVGGVLLLLDGDTKKGFCAKRAATDLAERATNTGAGVHYSVAIAFALQEYESWLIAGSEQLAGKLLPDGRPGLREGCAAPHGNLEIEPRGAKEWLSRHMSAGYKATTHQEPLTKLLLDHLDVVRGRMRSFRRVENALRELVDAIRNNQHIASPRPK